LKALSAGSQVAEELKKKKKIVLYGGNNCSSINLIFKGQDDSYGVCYIRVANLSSTYFFEKGIFKSNFSKVMIFWMVLATKLEFFLVIKSLLLPFISLIPSLKVKKLRCSISQPTQYRANHYFLDWCLSF